MKRAEINAKFDEIVAFAEIEQFLDTPVKRYSSGMYVRLAFAVAAHLEPEILLVDEVLAVGDAQFQRKCLGKMDDVAKEGRTVLFVSHNMNSVKRLCSQSIELEAGCLVAKGDTNAVLLRYLSGGAVSNTPQRWIDVSQCGRAARTGQASFVALSFSSLNEAAGCRPYSNGPLEFRLDITSDAARQIGSIAITIYDQYGTKLVNADSVKTGEVLRLDMGHNTVALRIEQLHLNPGAYIVGLWLADPLGNVVFDHVESAITLEVTDLHAEGLGRRVAVDGLVPCTFAIYKCDRRLSAPSPRLFRSDGGA
jgi:lipopolysaccharide transport system ATP-binding protein